MSPNDRPATLAGEMMVSSSHPRISTIGMQVLTDGGNAVDAALAMGAMSWLVLPGQCGIGGDAFCVVREPDGRVWSTGGSGFGPDGGTADCYRGHGFTTMPLDGPWAVAVPGAVAAMAAMATEGATRSLTELWEPAADTAERGLPCSLKTSRDIITGGPAIARDPDMAAAFLRGNKAPRPGDPIVQGDLAATIRATAADPLGYFYAGEFAERALSHLRADGVPFSGDEWAMQQHTQVETPLSGPYSGAHIHQTGMPSAGWMVLQQARLCDRAIGLQPWLSAEAIDRFAQAAAYSFRDRFELCGSDTDAWSTTLSDDAIAQARTALDGGGTMAPRPFATAKGDTTSMVVVDSEGRAASFIHSLAYTFGAKSVVPGTGVILNNRLGRGFYLIDGHPNEVRPRRKPLHTLNTWLVTGDDGELLHVGNTPGGDGQVQWNMQILSHLIDHGLNPQDAVSAPRFSIYPGSDSDSIDQPMELRIETRVGENVMLELDAMGHTLHGQGPWGADGSAQVISVDNERGVLSGGCDPRQEGVTLGW